MKTLLRKSLIAAAGALLAAVGSLAAAATIVTSNNLLPGDTFTNPSSVNQGQAVGSSGWYYNNVRNGATVGIDQVFARHGNGSARFVGQDSADKADLEYLAHAINLFGNFYATGTLGSFSALSSFGYEWYRSAASTSAGHLHPVMRVLLDADGNLATTHDRGGLVYERVYNEAAGWAAATNSWVAESIGASTYLWSFGLGLPFAADINGNGYGYDATLADWQMYLPSAVIIGFSLGIGSGWGGDFLGAVDSARWTIGGITSAFNFEVRQAGTVPEPASGAVLAAAWIAGILVAKRRWRAA